MKQSKLWAWVIFGVGLAYFMVPLIATFEFSLRMRRGYYSFDSYASVFSDPRFQATFGYSALNNDGSPTTNGGAYTIFGIGSGVAGNNQDAWAMGLRHRF